jgi:hypothetical protein
MLEKLRGKVRLRQISSLRRDGINVFVDSEIQPSYRMTTPQEHARLTARANKALDKAVKRGLKNKLF